MKKNFEEELEELLEKKEKRLVGKEKDTSDIDKEIKEILDKEKEKLEKNNKKLRIYLEQYKDHEKTKERIEEQIKKNDKLLENIKRVNESNYKDLETAKIKEIFGIKKKDQENKKENEYDSRLTKEQKDELIAEGIEPGDPEYLMALENYGIKLENKSKEQEPKKVEDLSLKSTQEPKDEFAVKEVGSSNQESEISSKGVNATTNPVGHIISTDSSENKEKKKEEKIKIELSAEGLTVDGILQDFEENNKWYENLKEKKKLEIEFMKNDLEKFSNMQLNIFKALLKKDVDKNRDGFTILDRLNSAFEYSDEFKEKHNIDISIDLTRTSIIDRMLGRCKLSVQDVKEMKDMAYEMRNTVTIKAGPLTRLGFKIREMFDKTNQKNLPTVEKVDGEEQESEKKNDFKEGIKVREDSGKKENTNDESFELKLEYNNPEKTNSNTEMAQTCQDTEQDIEAEK